LGLPAVEREKREWRAYRTRTQRPAVREQSRESIKDRPVFYSIIAAAGGSLAVRGSRLAVRSWR